MAEVVLDSSRVVASIRQRVAAGMSQHMRMDAVTPLAELLKVFGCADILAPVDELRLAREQAN